MTRARYTVRLCLLIMCWLCFGCTSQHPSGPDRAGMTVLEGMTTGATTGAITAFHVGSGVGPGALVGAGLGMVAGGLRGLSLDVVEQHRLELEQKLREEEDRAYAYQVILDHYDRRLSLYPSRDIFPADVFFYADGHKIRRSSKAVVEEFARLQLERLPWSRLMIASYVKSHDPESPYAVRLASQRAESIGDEFVRQGIEPRRIVPKAVLITEPLVVDPQDDPLRYNQAVEFVFLDR